MSKVISVVACSVVVIVLSVVANPISLGPQQPINHGGKIETKYDGFSFETVMRLRKMKVTCGGLKDSFKDGCVSIDIALHCPGTQINHVRDVTIQIIFETRNWNAGHPPDERDLSLVVDAETLRVGRMRLLPRSDSPWSDTSSETLEATLPYNVFKKMVQSQSVAMQVGRSTVELKEKNRAALRDLDSRVLTP